MKRIRTIIAVVVMVLATTGLAQTYQSKLLGHETEIDNIIKQMTLEEKIVGEEGIVEY